MNITRDEIRVMIYYDYKKRNDYHSKNVFNLYKKHLATVAFHVQQFTIGMMNLIRQKITLKMNLVLLDQQVQSLQKTLKLSVSRSMLIRILHKNRYKDTLHIGSAATQSILHDYLGLRKITCRWVTQFLIEVQKQNRV